MSVATYPVYDDTYDASTWRVGMYASGTTGDNLTLAGTTVGWLIRTMRLQLQPGTYYAKTFNIACAFMSDTYCSAAYFFIGKCAAGGTTSITPITWPSGLTYIDITADKGSDASHTIAASLGNVAFEIESGYDYYFGIGSKATAQPVHTGPCYRRMDAGVGPLGAYFYDALQDQAAWPSTISTWQAAGAGTHMRMAFTFTTAVRTVFKIATGAYSAAAEVLVPHCTDKDYIIKFGSAVVADGQAFTCALKYDNDSAEAARTTLVLDMGAADQVTFGGANSALVAGEAGETFDLAINVRPVTGKMDCLYQNMTTPRGPVGGAYDWCTISQAAKAAAARDADYTVGAPNWLDMSGTAAVTSLEVGWEPLVIFGDSQCIYSSDRLGSKLPTAFTYDRIYWMSASSGNRLTANSATTTAGYLRYKHTTPGQGDLCAFTGVVFVYGSFGVNDITDIGTTEASRNKVVATILTRVSEILDDLAEKANTPVVIALPPYSISPAASEQEAQAIKDQLNIGLEGLAIANRCAFVNPWWDMVDLSTATNTVPTFLEAYTSDSGLHYVSAGAAIVADLAASALEEGLVGGPWRKRYPGARRPGMLLPL